MGSDSNCQSTPKWLQPKGWVVCYTSPTAGLAPALLDKWKRWVNYLKGRKHSPLKVSAFSECLHWFQMVWGSKLLCSEKVLSMLIAACVGYLFHLGEVAWGTAWCQGRCPLLPLIRPRAVGCVFTACSSFFLFPQRGVSGAASDSGAKPSQQNDVFAPSNVCAWLCSATWAVPPVWGWLLYVCRWKDTAVGALCLEWMNTSLL